MIPVVLFCYNRPNHTRRVLNALQRNPEAGQTEVWIFSDGPRAGQEENVQEVRSLLQNIRGFKEVRLILRPENLGLSRNIRSGITEVLENHEGVIVLEDDLIPTDNFLAFMNSALTAFRQEAGVHSVGAYVFPETAARQNETLPDVFPSTRFSCWGWGIWKDRWEQMDWTVPERKNFLADPRFRDFHRTGNDLPEMMLDLIEGKNNSWAVLAAWHVVKNGLFCIYPGSSKVQNIGFDGSGVHSHDLPDRAEVVDSGSSRDFRLEILKDDPRSGILEKSFRNSAFRKFKNLWAYGRWF